MRNTSFPSIVLGAALALAGCHAEVAVQPPSEVISAFKRDHPEARETKVEKETQQNGDVRYDYKYTDANGNHKTAEYDERGNNAAGGGGGSR